MSELSVASLRFWLNSGECGFHAGVIKSVSTDEFLLLEPGEDILYPELLYIGDALEIAEAVDRGRIHPEGSLLISAGKLPASFHCPQRLTLIETSFSLCRLHNLLRDRFGRFRRWKENLLESVCGQKSHQYILDSAEFEMQASLLLVNSNFRLMASVENPDVCDPIIEELHLNRYQSSDSVQAVCRQMSCAEEQCGTSSEFVSDCSGNRIFVRQVRYRKKLSARLYVIQKGASSNPYLADLATLLSVFVARRLNNGEDSDCQSSDYDYLIEELIECRIADPRTLETLRQHVRFPFEQYYHLFIISFSSAQNAMPVPLSHIMHQFEQSIPFSRASVYCGEILLLARWPAEGTRYPIDKKALTHLLDLYDCCMGISNLSAHLSFLAPVYHQTKAGLRIGHVMDPERRIYYYEDYAAYHMVELAAETAPHTINSRNLIHLCNNDVVILMLHDRRNGTNLLETLYTYLTYACNATEAAKALFIHRNTMLNKLQKIESLIGRSLQEYSMLRERLLFSCRVLIYIQRYLGKDPLELSPLTKTVQSDD